MVSNFKKVVTSVESRGAGNTAKKIIDKLKYESRCRFTEINLGVRRSFSKNAIVIDHGKYKFNFYGGGDKAEILYHTFWEKMFAEDRDKIKYFVKKGDFVIDVGGNMGFFVLVLNELIGDSGKIYSFEPSYRLSKKLTSTIEINNLKNVEIVNLALGESEGRASLNYNPNHSGLSSIVSNTNISSLAEEIKITTLDNFSKNFSNRISFIKIDTEGFEPQVLKGAKELINKDKPTIYIELGGDNQSSSFEALQVLKELNYSCEAENLDLSKIPAGVNFIATPKP